MKNPRTLSLCFAAILGALLAFPIQTLWWAAIDGLMTPLAPITPSAAVLLGFLLLLVLSIGVLEWLSPRWSHFQELVRHPPILAAAISGYALFVVIFSMWSEANALERLILGYPVVPFGIGIAVCCHLARRRLPPSVEADIDPQQRLEIWLSGEDPILDSSLDLANMGRKAGRLVSHLQEWRHGANEHAHTLAIRGPFGSGKTSLTHIIENAAPTDRAKLRLIFARTNCWGFEDASRAQEHILRSCVTRLNDLVDTTALRSLPKHYVEAIGETPFKLFGTLLGDAPEPIKLLQQFSPVLESINVRMVVVIEDLDRAGEDFDQAQIFALLHRLRHVNRMSFILTTGGDTPVELHKVAEHVEFLDNLDTQTARNLIRDVRAQLLATSFIDPQSLTEKHHSQKRRFVDFATEGSYFWPPHVSALLSNLRTLKFALRDYRSRWQELCGEVDLDELLMLLALRYGAPPAYEFLMTNAKDILFLRQFRFNDAGNDRQQHTTKLKTRWEAVIARNDFNVEAAASVLNELFPGIGTIVGDFGRSYGIRVQSVRGEREDIYLNRIHTGELEADAVREQIVLARMQEAAGSAVGMDHLLEGIRQIPGFADLVRFFQRDLKLLSEQQEFEVVGRLLQGARTDLGARATIHDDELHGMEEWTTRHSGELDTKRDWYVAELRESAPVSMTLTSHLLGRAFENLSLVHFAGVEIVQACCERIAALSTAQFVSTLCPEIPHSLQWLFNHLYADHAVHWRPVIHLLLAAMREYPPQTLYPAALIFVNGSHQLAQAKDHFVDARVRTILGDQARTYYTLIAQGATPPEIGENHWEPFRTAARILLDESAPAAASSQSTTQ